MLASAKDPAVFDLKSANLTLVSVVLKTCDLAALEQELAARMARTPHFFNQDPVVIDLREVRDDANPLDVPALVALLRQYKMVPIAAKSGSDAQMQAALDAGLTESPEGGDAKPAPVRVETVVQEVVKEVVREVPVPTAATTVVVDKPLRSGQQVYAKGADLVVLAMVSFGAEVIADGSIHVYAPLRGKAIAGARGNQGARIFTTCLEPELISIAGIYRTTDTPLPDNVAGKPAQIRLEGEKLIMEPLVL